MTHDDIQAKLRAIDVEQHRLAIECGRIGHVFDGQLTCRICTALDVCTLAAPPADGALMEAIAIIGSRTKLAKAIGATKFSVNNWLNEGEKVPLKRCPAIERATGGRVRCEQLRPDVAWGVLREQSISAPAEH